MSLVDLWERWLEPSTPLVPRLVMLWVLTMAHQTVQRMDSLKVLLLSSSPMSPLWGLRWEPQTLVRLLAHLPTHCLALQPVVRSAGTELRPAWLVKEEKERCEQC